MRININIADDMGARVDEYAKPFGVSRSALCAMIIGQGVAGLDKSMELVDSLGKELGEDFIESEDWIDAKKRHKTK